MFVKVKKSISLLLVIVFSMALFVGCGNQAKTTQNQTKKIKVGVSLAAYSFTFVTYVLDGMKIYQKQHPELEITYVDAKNDANNQFGQVETFITQGYDAIILMPVDAKTTAPMVKACADAKIPLVGINRKFVGPNTFVGCSNVQGGQLMAETMIKIAGGKGNLALMHGLMGQASEVERTQGIKEVLAKNPDMKIVLEGAADWDRAKGLTLVENWLQSGTKFNCIIGESDEMAIGAFKAVDGSKVRDKYIIGGSDGGPAGLQAVKDGNIDYTLFQDPYKQSANALESAEKLAKGEKVDKELILKYELVTKDNVDKYLKLYADNKIN